MASRRYLPNILFFVVAAVIGAVAFMFLKDMDPPSVVLSPDTDRVSPNTVLSISMEDASGLRELSVGVRRNNQVTTFFRKHYDDAPLSRVESVPMREARAQRGAFELEIKVTDASMAGFGQGNTKSLLLPMRLDDQPPRISIKTMPGAVYRGGSSALRYTVDEDVSETGVLIGDYFVRAFRQADGSYVCVYPFPFTMGALDFKKILLLTATDLAGNVTRTHFTVMAYEKKFRNDNITVTDSFLETAQAKLGHLAPDALSPLQSYLAVNTRVRSENMETLRGLNALTASTRLWDGPFMSLPKGAARAGYADRRALLYNGQQVGEAYHLGLDLASLRNAPIPASNNGTVLFAGELGIYGNIVVIDHGLGVQTLYSHMSEIQVSKGQSVKRGDILGKTGSTGLAFGDHLHFGVLVGGLEVNPVEWIDPKWLANLVKRINGE